MLRRSAQFGPSQPASSRTSSVLKVGHALSTTAFATTSGKTLDIRSHNRKKKPLRKNHKRNVRCFPGTVLPARVTPFEQPNPSRSNSALPSQFRGHQSNYQAGCRARPVSFWSLYVVGACRGCRVLCTVAINELEDVAWTKCVVQALDGRLVPTITSCYRLASPNLKLDTVNAPKKLSS